MSEAPKLTPSESRIAELTVENADLHAQLETIVDQAARYFLAVHGPRWVYKAPEDWTNPTDLWIWALMHKGHYAETAMAKLEAAAAEAKR